MSRDLLIIEKIASKPAPTESAALVNDIFGAAFTRAHDFSVSRSAFVDDFQRVMRDAIGLNLRGDFAFQFFAWLARCERSACKTQ